MRGGVPKENRCWIFVSARIGAAAIAFLIFVTSMDMRAQCPDTGETKVTEAKGGYLFFKFLGNSSFVYFLPGKEFSLNDKDDPGKTFVKIDDFVYEPLMLSTGDLREYVHSSKDVDMLREQAKHAQEHFKRLVPSLRITDYGPSPRKNDDGSDGREFYLWKKENSANKDAARQYLLSTVVKSGIAVMSFMPLKDSISEAEVFQQMQAYVGQFDLLPAEVCAKVHAMPVR